MTSSPLPTACPAAPARLHRYETATQDSIRWDAYRPREGDIIVTTAPKCGTTWTQMLCALLVHGPELPAPLSRISPEFDRLGAPVEALMAELDAQAGPRIIKTHTPLDGLPFDERVTYISVGRDPRDVALSADNHFSNMDVDVFIGARARAVGLDDLAELMPDGVPPRPEDFDDRFEQWMVADLTVGFSGLSLVVHHLDTFWQCRSLPNVVLFHYADLQADLKGEMGRLARHLRIDVDDDALSVLAAAASFDSMRSRSDELAPESDTAGFWHSTERFFAGGTAGRWRSVVSPERLARYEARLRELAAPDLAQWVASGWRGMAELAPGSSARPDILAR